MSEPIAPAPTPEPTPTPSPEPTPAPTPEPTPIEVATTFANGKYTTVSELEKGYENLHSKFGSFSGAPEAYSVAEGTEINGEHPILESIQSFGKENNLSNEGYQNLINVLMENEKADIAEQTEQAKQVITDLGPNANERIQNIDDFIGANLQADDNMKNLIDQAKEQPGGVELIEALIGMTKKTAPASERVATPTKTYNKDELHKLQFANNEYGDRKMNDPTYRKMVEEYSANLQAQR